MRTISALEVRAKFGQVLDEAAAGERFVVERAGHGVAAIVPLADLEALDPAKARQRRIDAVDRLVQLRRLSAGRIPTTDEIVAGIRQDRESH